MRRYILFALLLCLQWTARGQATYDYRYWFDSDEKNLQTGTATGNSWHIDADVSELSCTYHSIHMQVKDTAGVWSVPVTRYFIKQPDPNGYWGYYWFNQDLSTKTTIPVESRKFQIDVSALDNKMHTMHYQFNDPQNNATPIWTAFFIKTPKQGASKFHYWTDNNTDNVRTGECSGGVMMLDMTAEEDGFHVLHIQGEMDKELTQPQSRMFIKIPQTEGGGDLTCLCYVDGDLYKQEKVPSEGGIIDWTLDVSSLANGFHRVLVQVVTPSGAATSVHESFFFRTTMTGELETLKLVYSVDGGKYETQAGDFGTGVFHFDLDVSELTDGLHRINYMLMSETGTSTKMNSSFFIKTPKGGPGVASYKYWINEHEDEAVKVVLDERQELFSLISLLPVKTCPIRSSCFHFEIEDDGTAMMYAKNDFHIQFLDVKHYFLNATRQYVDYNVGQEIDKFTLLESGKRVYKTKPDENEVIWFKVEAVEGDSLSIKTDQACSLQIFSPSGKEMFTASGSESVVYDGCHAEEDGTYYIALHDVTGTKGTTIALDFQHIDKYDVLRWDVSTVGNGGASTITYEGNGFKDLYAIDYVNANGDTIKCDFIDHISDATISTITDYNGVSIGSYKAIFHFTEEDKVIDNAVKVEEATEMKLGIKVNYPSTFLRGTSCTYNIQITNYGNMTAYNVPLELRLSNANQVLDIAIDGDIRKMVDIFKYQMLDSLDIETKTLIQELSSTKGGMSQFIIYKDSINQTSYGISQIFINIPPNTNKNINVNIKSNKVVNLNAYTSAKWLPLIKNYTSDNVSTLSKTRGANTRDWMCCYKERIQCVADIAANFTSMLPPGLGCAASLTKTGLSAGFDIWCSEGTNVSERWHNYLNNEGKSLAQDLIGSLVDCVTSYYRILKKSLRDDYNLANSIGNKTEADRIYSEILAARRMEESLLRNIYDGISTLILGDKCIRAFTESKPNCPIPPIGGGGSSDPVNSYDPNDIYGYRSESGSKAVMKGQKEVYYTIEFENDTAFATASAQDVYLTDTLDARYFDLKSFSPTSLKIGDKKVELNGDADFVTTVDMRPRINAIAQVECDYDSKTGIAKWHFSSLDPMTMEPVETPMDGFLPVNNSDGDGMGEVSFNINLKDDFEDGTEISNRASIVFDYNEAIITPTWTNVIDTIAPKGNITRSEMKNDSTLTLHLGGTDNRSGIWKYDIYVQPEEDCSWYKAGENVADTVFNFILREGIDYGFCVIATDSAGNVEQKVLERQWSASSFKLGDANGDRTIDAADVVLTISKYLGNYVEINTVAADVNCDGVIDAQDIVGIQQIFLQSEVKPRGIETKKRIRLWQRQ